MRLLLVCLVSFCVAFSSESDLGVEFDLFGKTSPTPSKKDTPKAHHRPSLGKGSGHDKIPSTPGGSGSSKTTRIKAKFPDNAPRQNLGGGGNFIYSVALLTLFFDNGVQRTGYAVLLKDGYMITTAGLVREPGSYVKTIYARMQDDSSNSIMCVASLVTRAADDSLALLQPISYTDKYCNLRPESFYHQRINVKYARGLDNLKTKVVNRTEVFFPFVDDNDSMVYKTTSRIDDLSESESMPMFSRSGDVLGIVHNPRGKGRAVILPSSRIRDFVCRSFEKKILDLGDLTSGCTRG